VLATTSVRGKGGEEWKGKETVKKATEGKLEKGKIGSRRGGAAEGDEQVAHERKNVKETRERMY